MLQIAMGIPYKMPWLHQTETKDYEMDGMYSRENDTPKEPHQADPTGLFLANRQTAF